MDRLRKEELEVLRNKARNGSTYKDAMILAAVIELQHYRDLTEAGRLVEQQYETGDWVYVVERDENGEAYEIAGFIFIATCKDAVIVSPRINLSEDLEVLLKHHIEDSAEGYNTCLAVYPLGDCYTSKEEAEANLEKGCVDDE